MLRAVVVLTALAGCGRFGFGTEAPSDAGDAQTGDGFDDDVDAPLITPTSIALAQMSPVVAPTGGDIVLSLAAPSTAGSLLVITLGTNATSNLVLPSGWTLAAQQQMNGACASIIAYQPNNPGGITSVTVGQIGGVPSAAALTEWTGVVTAMPLDATGNGSSNNPIMAQSVQTTAATTADGELAITSFCEDINMPTYSPGAAWTNIGTFSNNASSPSFISDYRIGVAAGPVAETVTSSLAGKYAATIATFRSQ